MDIGVMVTIGAPLEGCVGCGDVGSTKTGLLLLIGITVTAGGKSSGVGRGVGWTMGMGITVGLERAGGGGCTGDGCAIVGTSMMIGLDVASNIPSWVTFSSVTMVPPVF